MICSDGAYSFILRSVCVQSGVVVLVGLGEEERSRHADEEYREHEDEEQRFGLLVDEDDIIMLKREHAQQKVVKRWMRCILAAVLYCFAVCVQCVL